MLLYASNVRTGGHRYKLHIAQARKLMLNTHFMHRIVPAWNFLPDHCFSPDKHNAFRTKIYVKLILAGTYNVCSLNFSVHDIIYVILFIYLFYFI